jgi:transcriptional regulator with XRE-family HTH domain
VRRTKDALEILDKVTGPDESVRTAIREARVNFEVAQMICDARMQAGITQRELAAIIGSKQPVIARLEDADYEGHSPGMLQRIGAALRQRVEIRFVPVREIGRGRKRSVGRERGRKPPPVRKDEA